MGTTTRIWLAIVWIGISVEGLWFLIAFGMTGIINPKYPSDSLTFLAVFALWVTLFIVASFFRRVPQLLPYIALVNLVGCVALRNISVPWSGTRSNWLYFARAHLMDFVILVSSYLAYRQRKREQIEWQHGIQ